MCDFIIIILLSETREDEKTRHENIVFVLKIFTEEVDVVKIVTGHKRRSVLYFTTRDSSESELYI